MNIKITKEEAEFIFKQKNERYIIGSKLYKIDRVDSDTDILVLYESFHKTSDLYYPNYHQFQFDDFGNNIQYIFSSYNQFYKNLFSGDSTINADVVLFCTDKSDDEKLNMCRTFNVIKAFIGFAKRDLKRINQGKNKLFHIQRGLYCAEKLLNNELPILFDFKNFSNIDILLLQKKEQELRECCNHLFEKNELTMYPKTPLVVSDNSLEHKLIDANNIKEFKY